VANKRAVLLRGIIARACVCCHAVIGASEWFVSACPRRGVICGRCAEREGKEARRRNGGID